MFYARKRLAELKQLVGGLARLLRCDRLNAFHRRTLRKSFGSSPTCGRIIIDRAHNRQ
jgi:hypothetical protein